jgi:hypothetical protein
MQHHLYAFRLLIGYFVVSAALCIWILAVYKRTEGDPWWELLVAISATALFWPILAITMVEPAEQWRQWIQAKRMKPAYEALLAERARVEAEAGPVAEAIIAVSVESGAQAATIKVTRLERAVGALAFVDQRHSVYERLAHLHLFHGWYFDRHPRLRAANRDCGYATGRFGLYALKYSVFRQAGSRWTVSVSRETLEKTLCGNELTATDDRTSSDQDLACINTPPPTVAYDGEALFAPSFKAAVSRLETAERGVVFHGIEGMLARPKIPYGEGCADDEWPGLRQRQIDRYRVVFLPKRSVKKVLFLDAVSTYGSMNGTGQVGMQSSAEGSSGRRSP